MNKHIDYLNKNMKPFIFSNFSLSYLEELTKDEIKRILFSNYSNRPETLSCVMGDRNGVPLMFGGIGVVYPGVGETFGLVSDNIVHLLENGPDFTMAVIKVMDYFANALNLYRIQCVHPVQEGVKALEWLKLFGLREEGVLLSKLYGKV